MKIRDALVGLVLLLAVGGLGYLGYHYLVLSSHTCDICGRALHVNLQATVFLKNGSRVDTCCSRCAMHYELQKPHEVTRVTVDDSITGEPVEAREATYLEGSDAEGCHPASVSLLREPGVQYGLKFDRCLPSLVAFKDKSATLAFQKEHGGRLLSFAQAVESVKHR